MTGRLAISLLVNHYFIFIDEGRLDPRTEAVFVRRSGCIAPREILVVKLDGGQIIRLEIGDPVARLGADDGAAFDAGDVARPVQADRPRDAFALRAAVRLGGV